MMTRGKKVMDEAESSGRKRKAAAKSSVSSSTNSIKRPTSAYAFFMKSRIIQLKCNNPEIKIDHDVKKKIGNEYKKLPDKEKEVFLQKFQNSSNEYKKKKKKHELIFGEKKKVQTRLSLTKIVELNERLTEGQKEAVRNIGFGSILHLKCTNLKHALCNWIMDNFDPLSMTLDVYGTKLEIGAEDVEHILGLPNRGLPVPTRGPDSDIVEVARAFSATNIIPLGALSNKLNACTSDGDEFKAMYCLFVVGYLLCPSVDFGIKREMLHAIKDVNALTTYNWAQYVIDSLAVGVQHTRALGLKYVSGCLFLLKIFFFEHVNPCNELSTVHGHRPCIKFWTNYEVSSRLKKYKKLGGYICPEACIVVGKKAQKLNESVSSKLNKSVPRNQYMERLESKVTILDEKFDDLKKEFIGMKDDLRKDVNEVKSVLHLIFDKVNKLDSSQVKEENRSDDIGDMHQIFSEYLS